jgi:hypothetical protein
MAVRLGLAASRRRPNCLRGRRIRDSAALAASFGTLRCPLVTRNGIVRSAGHCALTPRFTCAGYAGGGFSSTSGGQRTRPVSKRPVVVLVPGMPLVPLLYLSQALNAILLLPLLWLMRIVGRDPELMGAHRLGRAGAAATLVATALLAVCLAALAALEVA